MRKSGSFRVFGDSGMGGGNFVNRKNNQNMQDQAVIEIGRVKGNKKAKPYQNFIQNLFPGKNYDMILAVFAFSKESENYKCEFRKVDFESASEKNYLQFAYRKGSARGGDITFTTKFGDIDKKFKIFYPKQVKDIIAFAKSKEEFEEESIFNALKNCLEKSGEEVKLKLEELYNSLDKKKQMSSGFSVRFEGLEHKEYLEGFKSVQKLLLKVGTEGKSEKYKVISEGHDELCSICTGKKPVLHGFASPFKYSTVDKTGLVSGFFKQKNNWKNYPICSDCALDFELGQKYVTQKLSKYFYGKNYYIIPKISVGSNPTLLKGALNILEDLEYKEKEGEKVATREDYLMKKIGKEEDGHNQFALNLLFYEENQTTKAIKIKLLLEEIFPSRFRTLFIDVPKLVNANPIYKEAITIKKEKRDLEFSFRILKTFFDKDFYEIIQTVFLGSPLSQELLFAKVMHLIRVNYNKSKTSDGFVEPTKWTVLKAMMMFAYLKELNIIPKNKTSKNMEKPNDQVLSEAGKDNKTSAFDDGAFRNFVEANKDFFDLDSGYKAGIFAVGVLVRQVFNWQSRNLEGNTPFEKKLKGYHLNGDILKNIYMEALEKLSNYASFHAYMGLRNFINEYFILNSHKLNQISNNELSFYFVAGLEFGNQFKTQKS